jgi:hypothetical protein
MVQLSQRTYDIQRVREVVPCAGGMQIVLAGGLSVCLRAEHPQYERILRQARSSAASGEPVGLMVGETRELLELNYTHQSAVRYVRPDEDDPSRLMVAFWAYSPICYLTRSHPEFERIKYTLAQALTRDEPVILANHVHPVEGETEIWWSIMDVRPKQA